DSARAPLTAPGTPSRAPLAPPPPGLLRRERAFHAGRTMPGDGAIELVRARFEVEREDLGAALEGGGRAYYGAGGRCDGQVVRQGRHVREGDRHRARLGRERGLVELQQAFGVGGQAQGASRGRSRRRSRGAGGGRGGARGGRGGARRAFR